MSEAQRLNRRSFFGLLAAAPVGLKATTCVAPLVAAINGAPSLCLGMVGQRVAERLPNLTLEEMEERYFKPYCIALENQWKEAERNGTAWWLPLDMQRGVNRPYYRRNYL